MILSDHPTCPASFHEKRHDCQCSEHHVIDGPRYRIPVREILPDRQPAQPEDKGILGSQQEEKRDDTHAESAEQCGRHGETENDPPGGNDGDTNMMGISISSAVRSPKRGTNKGTRMPPSRNPAPNTKAKYSAPAFRISMALGCLLRHRLADGSSGRPDVIRFSR